MISDFCAIFLRFFAIFFIIFCNFFPPPKKQHKYTPHAAPKLAKLSLAALGEGWG